MIHRLQTIEGQVSYYHNQLLLSIVAIERFGVALLQPQDYEAYETLTNEYAKTWETKPDSKPKLRQLRFTVARLNRLVDDISGDYQKRTYND